MTTQRNKAARAAETKDAKRTRLTDPALAGSVEAQRELQAANATLQRGIAAARAQTLANDKRRLADDIGKLAVQKARAAAGFTQATRLYYDAIYSRIERQAQAILDDFGEVVPYPAYDPPADNVTPKDFVTAKPRGSRS